MFWWFILYTTQQKWQKSRWILLLYQHFTSDFSIQNNFITMAKSMRKIIEDHGGCEQDFGKMFHDPKTRVFFLGVLLSRTGDCHHTHMRTMYIMVYLRTWLGDFGQGQMLRNIPAPWSIWDTGQGKSVTWEHQLIMDDSGLERCSVLFIKAWILWVNQCRKPQLWQEMPIISGYNWLFLLDYTFHNCGYEHL